MIEHLRLVETQKVHSMPTFFTLVLRGNDQIQVERDKGRTESQNWGITFLLHLSLPFCVGLSVRQSDPQTLALPPLVLLLLFLLFFWKEDSIYVWYSRFSQHESSEDGQRQRSSSRHCRRSL